MKTNDLKHHLATSALLILASACATAGSGHKEIAEQSLTMDPMLIRASVDEGELMTEVIEPSELLKRGTEAFTRRRYDEAIELYKVIIDEFPGSEVHMAALYNSGLAYERLGRHRDASRMYETVIALKPGTTEATDSLYRLAECQSQLGQWDKVVVTTKLILGHNDLSLYDKLEAHVRWGDAALHLGDLETAERRYRAAITMNNRADPDDAVPQKSHFVAAAHFGISQVYHRLFSQMKLRLPVKRMETDLEDKAQIFMQAQTAYIRTMRLGNPYWSTASGYHIGKMYEEFYTDILGAEIPSDLTAEEQEIYFEELRSKIKPLMQRAMQIYEKNIIMSERFGVDNDFTIETQRSLERLKNYIVSDELQAADEKQVIEGKAPAKVGQPSPDDKGRDHAAPAKHEPTDETPAKPPALPLVDDVRAGGA